LKWQNSKLFMDFLEQKKAFNLIEKSHVIYTNLDLEIPNIQYFKHLILAFQFSSTEPSLSELQTRSTVPELATAGRRCKRGVWENHPKADEGLLLTAPCSSDIRDHISCSGKHPVASEVAGKPYL
jgi:hypothetical protein